MFKRLIEKEIEEKLFKRKIIVLYGARQVGKTTICRSLIQKYQTVKKTVYLSGDEINVQKNLSSQNATLLGQYLGDADFIVIDEAQRVNNIGINLKIIIDNFPDKQILATGSSSFDLANQIKEPLTGRAFEFFLPPLLLSELEGQIPRPEIFSNLNLAINYGLYPEIFTSSLADKRAKLTALTNNYLFKDILDFEGSKHSVFVFKLLQLLAFQVGNEVSFTELSKILEVSKTLVEKYVDLLEKSFVVFRLNPFSRNLRNEIGKKRKIYFWDNGVRNALIQNFNDLDIRSDIGPIWENFLIAERIKYNLLHGKQSNNYYRRTTNKTELDYLEESNGVINAFEFKWRKISIKADQEFLDTYAGSTISLINQDNFWPFIGIN